jgi:DNA-3-methyladenine glycosylase II
MLDDAGLLRGVTDLAAHDPDLAGIVARHGPPPLWGRKPGFATLVHIILEQQVSLRSAAAALARLEAATGTITPAAIVATGAPALLEAGLTRQKTRYLVGLSEDVLSGRLDLAALETLDDAPAGDRLMRVVGIGRWTADIYLLMALRRPDIWPTGDLALAAALRHAKRLPTTPSADLQRAVAEAWRPWRAVAARILWHAYLQGER